MPEITLTLEEYRNLASLIGRPVSPVEKAWFELLDRKLGEQLRANSVTTEKLPDES